MRALEPTVLGVTASCLRLDPAAIDPRTPLARYGLDSLSSVELALALSEATGVQIEAEELLESPSIRSLAERLRHEPQESSNHPERSAREGSSQAAAQLRPKTHRGAQPTEIHARIIADSTLDPDIDPGSVEPAESGAILVTGATGFLGIHVLKMLLSRNAGDIVCAVRARSDGEAIDRVLSTARRYGLEIVAPAGRLRAIAADIAAPLLGRDRALYQCLAQQVASVYHCAAEVNWAMGYEGLRSANVHATHNLLHFASTTRRKRFCFVSSVAASYSTLGHAAMSEIDAAPDVRGIPLGYGQSKWAAERLVETCRARGLQATIVRPSLICGDTTSALGNDEDLLALLLRGCIELGSAPELAWRLDACPVDFVARAIVGMALGAANPDALHLRNPHPVQFTEVVLWLNLRGYPVVLEPLARWLERVETASREPDHLLHRLRGFLLARPAAGGGRSLAEIYADPAMAQLHADRSDRLLAALGLTCPRIGAHLLSRYFDSWIARGIVPQAEGVRRPARSEHLPACEATVEVRLRRHFGDPGLAVATRRCSDFGAEHSILGEFAAWHSGVERGMHALQLELHRADASTPLDLVVKPAHADATVACVAEQIAALCSPELGAAFVEHRQAAGMLGGARRERGIYADARGALRSCLPASYDASPGRDDALLLEKVDAPCSADVTGTAIWRPGRVRRVLDRIGNVHREWLGRESAIGQLLGRDIDAELAAAAQAGSLWIALSAHARPWLHGWIGAAGAHLQSELAEGAPRWLPQIASAPRTLVHNDFNPRNFLLRDAESEARLYAFDWELADANVPQRDLVELLSYVLDPEVADEQIRAHAQYHLDVIRRAGGAYAAGHWTTGLRLALADFGVRRLPLYFLAHRFRPQSYLPRITRTWRRLVQVLGRPDC